MGEAWTDSGSSPPPVYLTVEACRLPFRSCCSFPRIPGLPPLPLASSLRPFGAPLEERRAPRVRGDSRPRRSSTPPVRASARPRDAAAQPERTSLALSRRRRDSRALPVALRGVASAVVTLRNHESDARLDAQRQEAA